MSAFHSKIDSLLIFLIFILGLRAVFHFEGDQDIDVSSKSIQLSGPCPDTQGQSTPKIQDLMYHHPNDHLIRGRPFSGLIKYSHILKTYLKSIELEITPENEEKILTPQLVTGFSSDHFNQHRESVVTVFERFNISLSKTNTRKILVFDLGLTQSQINILKSDPRYIYQKFNFEKYPPHTKWLKSYAFKIFTFMECLETYQNCIWFDASINFKKGKEFSVNNLIKKYMIVNKSSFLYRVVRDKCT